MTSLDNAKIEEIRNSVDIVEIISEYLPLTQRGRNYFGVCPFHDDHSPSMSVSKELQIFNCFSCGAAGNVFKFVMDYENISFMDAVKKIAIKGGIDTNIGSIKTKKVKSSELFEMYELAKKVYQNNLNSEYGKYAKEYLKNREIDEDIIKEFGIGLSLNKNDILTSLFIKKEFKNADILKSGLVLESKKGLHDIYIDRIMFPLENLEGKVVGFSGRIYNKEDTSKYINTKETEIFKKGEILYNYARAKDECRIKKTVIIMEGFMDVIRAYTIGIKNVVASMGTAITGSQARLLKRLAPNIILLFDGDDAGKKAANSCIDELSKIDIIPKVVILEDNLDPDDYIRKKGKEPFLKKLENPINAMEFKMDYMREKKNLTDPNELATYINACLEELNKIDDDILREITINRLVNESGIDANLLRSKLKMKEKKEEKKVIIKPVKYYDKYKKSQRNLIYYMLQDEKVIKRFMKKKVFFPDDNLRSLANKVSYFYEEHENNFLVADFYTYVSESENNLLIEILSEILNMNLPPYKDEEIEDYFKVISEYNINEELSRTCLELSEDNSLEEKKEKLKKIIELKTRKN